MHNVSDSIKCVDTPLKQIFMAVKQERIAKERMDGDFVSRDILGGGITGKAKKASIPDREGPQHKCRFGGEIDPEGDV
jgi:hypothetical protein